MNANEVRRVLLLQGGGALGAYQAGAFEALAEAEVVPDWIAGISIGAINGALIAGNPPERRVARLRAFWERISSSLPGKPLVPGDDARAVFGETGAFMALAFGLPGFFTPHLPPPPFWPAGSEQALGWYDPAPLRRSLEELVDFDRLAAGTIRLSLGTVNVRSGALHYFDSARERLGPEHVMASAALPPAFPPVEIEGEAYWDGGILSNTPVTYVFEEAGDEAMELFQVDLWRAEGPMPRTIFDVDERAKDIRFASRSQLADRLACETRALRHRIGRLLDLLPAELRARPELAAFAALRCDRPATLLRVTYRTREYQSGSKDFDFSRLSVEEHWRAGYEDMRRGLRERGRPPRPPEGVAVVDLN